MNESLKVSVVINSYKNLQKLESCVKAVIETLYDNKEIIVVSYGIPKISIKASNVNSYIDKLILLKEDLGLPAQRNIGFKARSNNSKYVLFVDDDVLLTKLSIKNLISVLEKNPHIGVAQPLLVTPNGHIDCIGGFIDFLGYSYMPFHGESLSSFNARREYIPISYAAGACCCLRVDYFLGSKHFQPFDDSFYFNYEDADLSLRAWIRGIDVVCIPSAIAIHERGRTASLKRAPNHFIFLDTRNKFVSLTSVLEPRMLFVYIPFFIIFELLKAIYLLAIHPVHAFLTFKAILCCLKGFKEIWMRRKIVRKIAVKNNKLSSVIYKPAFSALIREFKIHYGLI
ncbi:MAG: glycosyltransferase family 2 protein [Candidatus Bathyarchaeia archaeon]